MKLLVLTVLLAPFLYLGRKVLFKLCKNIKNPPREVGFDMGLADFFLLAFLLVMSIFFGSTCGDWLAEKLSDVESVQFFLGSAVMHLLVVAVVILFIKKSDAKPKLFSSKQANVFKIAIGSAGYFYGLIAIIFFISGAWDFILTTLGVEVKPQNVVEYFKDIEGSMRYFALFSVIVIAPLSEELVFRGLLYGGLKNKIGTPFAAVLVSVLFALIHFSLPAFLPIFFLSLLLIAVYERYGDLRASMFVHSFFNGTMSLLMLLADKYIDV